VRLDAVLADASPSLIKLDIEGAEPLAFLGAEGLLRRQLPPVWILELQDRYLTRYDWTAARLVDWLESVGYQLATYDATGHELRLGGYEFVHSRMDVFAVSREKLGDVSDRLARHA
jgi:hypothetical protein